MNPDARNDLVEAVESPSSKALLERYGISPILFACLSLILIFLLYQGIGGLVAYVMFGVSLTREHITGLRVTTVLGELLLLLVPALALTRLATRTPASFLRLRIPRVSELFVPFIGIFSLQQVLQVYMVFQEKIPLPQSIQRIVEQLQKLIEETYKVLVSSFSIPELLVVILVVALVPAVAEEILFRGLIQSSFEQGMGGKWGLVLTAISFAAYHLNPFSFVPLLVLGLYLGFLVYSSNSLWVSVAAHFYNNLFACIAFYLGMNESFVITGNPEHLSVTVLLLTAAFFSVVFLISTYYFIVITRSSTLVNQL